MASECGRDEVREARREWRFGRQPRMRREPHRLVFVDETATTTKMTRPRGRARRHRRLMVRAPFGHWNTLSVPDEFSLIVPTENSLVGV